MKKMKILISGGSGFIGKALVSSFQKENYDLVLLQRKDENKAYFWNPKEKILKIPKNDKIDVVINLAGENISSGRWTSSKKEEIKNSRVEGTSLLSEFFSKAKYKPKVFISGSAIGLYGNNEDQILTENSAKGSGFLADVCELWENSAKSIQVSEVRTVFLRFGMILSFQGGALEKMLLPFKLFLGGIIGTGKQYISWISLDDVISVIHFILQNENLSGAINLVSPESVTNFDFTKSLGKFLKRPTIFPLPSFFAKLLFGEMAEELLLSSIRVLPKKLQEEKYSFIHSDLEKFFN
jgi:uncharacterized protein (TIGR01777 family)